MGCCYRELLGKLRGSAVGIALLVLAAVLLFAETQISSHG